MHSARFQQVLCSMHASALRSALHRLCGAPQSPNSPYKCSGLTARTFSCADAAEPPEPDRVRAVCCRRPSGPACGFPLGPGSPPQRPRHRLLDAAVALHALPECAASCTCPAAWTAPVLPTLPNAHGCGRSTSRRRPNVGYALDARLLAWRGHWPWGTTHPPAQHPPPAAGPAQPPEQLPLSPELLRLGLGAGTAEPADAQPASAHNAEPQSLVPYAEA